MADEPGYDHLVPVTVAVRDLIGESRELAGRMAQVMGMNPNDMAAIGALVVDGPTGVAGLAERLGIRSSSATVMVDRLERAGLVVRTRDPVDRRRVAVVETAAARRAAYDAWSPVIDGIDEVSRSLRPEEARVVADFLERVTAVARAAGRPEGGPGLRGAASAP